MPLPGAATKVHLDATGDDPKQARAELADLVDKYNALLTFLAASTITSTPLTVGEALEAAAGALQVKLDGESLLRSVAGLKLANVSIANGGTGAATAAQARTNLGLLAAATKDAGTLAGQVLLLAVNNQLPALDGSLLTNLPTPLISNSYDSGELTLSSAGAATLTHGLGGMPKVVLTVLRCKTAEHGYSVGDEMVLHGAHGSSVDAGMSLVISATTITARYSNEAYIHRIVNKSTGATALPTNANWRLIVRAYA